MVRGERVWPDKNVALLGVVGEIIFDAVHHKHAQDTLRESEGRFRQEAERVLTA